MVTMGVDAHKAVHHALALDHAGTVLGSWRAANPPAQWQQLLDGAAPFPGPRHWGIAGAWKDGRGLAQFLVAQGATGFEVNPRWTAAARRRARKLGKRDRLDAHAVAKRVRDAALTLPTGTAEDETAVLDLLVTEREAALAAATRLRNQLHQLLLQGAPASKAPLPSLTSAAGLRAVERYTLAPANVLQSQRAAAIRRLAQRLRLVVEQAAALEQEIAGLAEAHYQPLTAVQGVGLLTAGALAGILGPGQRCTAEGQLAASAGVAPLEASSAGQVRHRLNRGGNRRVHAIRDRLALAQARCVPAAQASLARRRAEGKSWREAIRALKRHLIRAIWRRWQACLARHAGHAQQPAA